jgi:hypothetical protein
MLKIIIMNNFILNRYLFRILNLYLILKYLHYHNIHHLFILIFLIFSFQFIIIKFLDIGLIEILNEINIQVFN